MCHASILTKERLLDSFLGKEKHNCEKTNLENLSWSKAWSYFYEIRNSRSEKIKIKNDINWAKLSWQENTTRKKKNDQEKEARKKGHIQLTLHQVFPCTCITNPCKQNRYQDYHHNHISEAANPWKPTNLEEGFQLPWATTKSVQGSTNHDSRNFCDVEGRYKVWWQFAMMVCMSSSV